MKKFIFVIITVLYLICLSSCFEKNSVQDNTSAIDLNENPDKLNIGWGEETNNDFSSDSTYGNAEQNLMVRTEKQTIIGSWHETDYVASNYSANYNFFADGSFIFLEDTGLTGLERLAYSGIWEFSDENLVLTIFTEDKVIKEINGEGVGFPMYESKYVKLEIPEVKILPYSGILYDTNYNYDFSIIIDGIRYWCLSDDPEMTIMNGSVYGVFGSWQASDSITEVYEDLYNFYDDGTFLFTYRKDKKGLKLLGFSGTWEYMGMLKLTIQSEEQVVKEYNDSKKKTPLYDSKVVKLDVSKEKIIEIFGKYPEYDKEYPYTFVSEGIKYRRLYRNPRSIDMSHTKLAEQINSR